MSCVAVCVLRGLYVTQDKKLDSSNLVARLTLSVYLSTPAKFFYLLTSFVLNKPDFDGVLRCQVDVEIVHPLALLYCVGKILLNVEYFPYPRRICRIEFLSSLG